MELSLIAKTSNERRYRPGQIIASAGSVLSCLIVVLEGQIEFEDGRALPPIIGVTSLLYEHPLPHNLISEKQAGAFGLIVNKEHFFTIVHECPAFIVGMMNLSSRNIYV